jgi:hypothetical protein
MFLADRSGALTSLALSTPLGHDVRGHLMTVLQRPYEKIGLRTHPRRLLANAPRPVPPQSPISVLQ